MDVTLFPIRKSQINLSAHRFRTARVFEGLRAVQFISKDLADGVALECSLVNPSHYLAQAFPQNADSPLSDIPVAAAALDTFIALTSKRTTLRDLVVFHDKLSKTRAEILEQRENEIGNVLNYIGSRYAFSLVCALGGSLCTRIVSGEATFQFNRATKVLNLRINERSPLAISVLPPISESLVSTLPLFLGETLSEFALTTTIAEARSAFESISHSAERGSDLISERYAELYSQCR